jgi:hypothetical protein
MEWDYFAFSTLTVIETGGSSVMNIRLRCGINSSFLHLPENKKVYKLCLCIQPEQINGIYNGANA